MTDPIKQTFQLATPWQTLDPFLFSMHHLDHYPPGNEEMGVPPDKRQGRNIGMDFSGKDGWSMYHGDVVPGFPQHPHRGFETITLARQGFIDHSDSLGATARFGRGDVQWMTAGGGVVHSEMFPLVHEDRDNPTELLQIWLNLPKSDKMTDPFFTMFWSEDIPRKTYTDSEGRTIDLTVIAGPVDGLEPPSPPPGSWASKEGSDVALWTLRMDPNAEFTLPAGPADVNRVLYFFAGDAAGVAGREIPAGHGVHLQSDVDVDLAAGDEEAEFVVLQGRPIDEPVVQQGPFVVNTQGELRQTMIDYHETRFGGWPFDSPAPVHPRDQGRFAIHVDGTREAPRST